MGTVAEYVCTVHKYQKSFGYPVHTDCEQCMAVWHYVSADKIDNETIKKIIEGTQTSYTAEDYVEDEKQTFKTGAQRSKTPPTRFDLISPIALERLAQTYHEGAEIYGDHNWERGFPFSDVLNHLEAHIVMYKKIERLGLKSAEESLIVGEDHLAHAAWGLFTLMHFEETHPELNDLNAMAEYGLDPLVTAKEMIDKNRHHFEPRVGASEVCQRCSFSEFHTIHYEKMDRSTNKKESPKT